MKVPFVALKRQFLSLEDNLLSKFRKIGKSGQYIMGNELNLFEKNFSVFCKTRYSLGVGNGSDAIVFALKACGISHGDEVIIPANSFIATAWAVAACNAKPVFVDINDDLNINPDLIENKITKKSKAIIAVHYTGKIANMDLINKIAKRNNLFVVEDAAQSIGAIYKKKMAGSLGHFGCFSFHPLKNLGLYGDGGAITIHNKKSLKMIQMLRNHGLINRDVCRIWGYNSRLDEIQAAFANIKLKKINKWNSKHRNIAFNYINNLSKKIIVPKEEKYEKSVFHNFIIRVKNRKKLIDFLSEKKIETKIHYPIPLHLQPVSANLGYKKGDMPRTEKFSKEILSLPIYPELQDTQQEYVINSINKFYA